MSLWNVGSTDDSCNKQALETIRFRMMGISPKYIVPQRRTNRETPIPLPKRKQVTFQETPKPSPRFTKKPVAPLLKKPNVNVPLSTGIKSAIGASKPASKSNAWIYWKLPAKSAKGEKVEEHIRNLNKNNHVDSHVKRSTDCSLVFGFWILRHIIGDRSKLINYVEKFIVTVRFENDQFAKIVGYGDYKLGDTIISRVYYVEGLNHNLFSVGQFCDG
nr:integrase, catalytic region, zinc finger, CCHC-type, peptidase aspartic, catalytic [Tanacetum cinerariifolium]